MQEYTYLAFLEGVIMFSEQSSLCFLSNMTSAFFFLSEWETKKGGNRVSVYICYNVGDNTYYSYN